MESGGVRFVRKRDFQLRVGLNPDNPVKAAELVEAIHVVKPSFMSARLILQVYQPLVGSVHETVSDMCENGVREIRINTLIPGRPDLAVDDDSGHLIYRYEDGKVIDQETVMSKDAIDGDDFMVHHISLQFLKGSILTNEWVSENNILRPRFGASQPDGQKVPTA